MRPFLPLLSGLCLLAGLTPAHAQAVPATAEVAPAILAAADPAPHKMLLKVGLNAGRVLRNNSYYGIASRVPVTVGAEYLLSRKFTVYGQVDSDFNFFARDEFNGERSPIIPTGALGLGVRYYYNQAAREQQNRAHGPFVGNYLALEGHTEWREGFGTIRKEVAPALNLLWGMQRRLGSHFLFDFNAGAGLGATRGDSNFGYSTGSLNVTTQCSLGLYFAH